MEFKKLSPLDVGIVLNNIYNSEINIQIKNFWDSGFDFEIGDSVNGIKELSEETKTELQKHNLDWNKIEDVVSALCYSITQVYPESDFTQWYKNKVHKIYSK